METVQQVLEFVVFSSKNYFQEKKFRTYLTYFCSLYFQLGFHHVAQRSLKIARTSKIQDTRHLIPPLEVALTQSVQSTRVSIR